MYQHYLEQNCNTILLPPIFPEADKKKKLIRENSDNRKVLKIVYAGALASKDYIDTLLHAIIRLNTDTIRLTAADFLEKLEAAVAERSVERMTAMQYAEKLIANKD